MRVLYLAVPADDLDAIQDIAREAIDTAVKNQKSAMENVDPNYLTNETKSGPGPDDGWAYEFQNVRYPSFALYERPED